MLRKSTKNDKKESDDRDIEDPVLSAEEEAAEAKKKGESPPSLSRLFKTVKPEQPMLVFGLILLFAAESTSQVIPLIVARAYDAIISVDLDESQKMSDINYYMLISIIIFLSGIFAGFLRGSIFAVIG